MSSYEILQGDATKLPLADGSVDLVFFSPPYPEKGERYDGARRPWSWREWSDWMVEVVKECLRVSRGPVCVVANNPIRNSRYLPACERLVVALHDAGVALERPCIWYKNAPPNRRDWLGNNWEYVLVAKHPGPVPHFDWQSIAEPPKYKKGGRFRQRGSDGKRRLGNEYPELDLAKPRDVFRITVGGGHLGSKLAHENEAPFPEKLVEPFVKLLCPPGGTVLDPFCGSGTTLAVAYKLGRNAIGVDIRETQVELTKRRMAETEAALRRPTGTD